MTNENVTLSRLYDKCKWILEYNCIFVTSAGLMDWFVPSVPVLGNR